MILQTLRGHVHSPSLSLNTKAHDSQRKLDLCDTHYRVGRVHSKKMEDLSLALKDFTQASQCAPKRADIWNALAHIHERLGKRKKALTFYKKALTHQKRYSPALLGMARYHLHSKKPNLKKAEKLLKRAIRYDPTLGEPHYHLCAIHQSRSRNVARKYCKKYMKLDPTGPFAPNAKEIIKATQR